MRLDSQLISPTAAEVKRVRQRGYEIKTRLLVECKEATYPATNHEGFDRNCEYVADELIPLGTNLISCIAVYQTPAQHTWEAAFNPSRFRQHFKVLERLDV